MSNSRLHMVQALFSKSKKKQSKPILQRHYKFFNGWKELSIILFDFNGVI